MNSSAGSTTNILYKPVRWMSWFNAVVVLQTSLPTIIVYISDRISGMHNSTFTPRVVHFFAINMTIFSVYVCINKLPGSSLLVIQSCPSPVFPLYFSVYKSKLYPLIIDHNHVWPMSCNKCFPSPIILLAALLYYRYAATSVKIFLGLLPCLRLRVILVRYFPYYDFQHRVINLLIIIK